MGPAPSIAPAPIETNRGCQFAKGYPSLGGFSGSSHFQNLAALNRRPPSQNWARDQASAVGVGSDSDCGGASRERARLRLFFIGCEAASSRRSDFDSEAGVRLGAG
jgi:hypothetical protein